MKKLLILGGASPHCQVVRRAKEMGIYTIVSDYLPYEHSPAKQIADESLQVDIYDIDVLVDYVKNNNVDGVLNFCLDPCTVPAFKIASECGLRTFGTEEQVMVMSDKSLFKKTCIRYGLPVMKSYSKQDVHDGKVTYPVIVKPRVGRGSREVHVCNDADAVIYAINSISKRPDGTVGYLIEEFAPHESCPFLTIQYIVIAGEPYLVYFGDNIDVKKKHGLECYFSMMHFPSPILDGFMEGDHQLFVNFIRKLGIRYGAMMFQSFFVDGHIRTVDMGLRFHGIGDIEVLKDEIGIDVLEPMISYAVGDDMVVSDGIMRGPRMFENRSFVVKFILLKAGTIWHVAGFDKLLSHPQISGVVVRCHEGMVVPPSGDARQDAAHIVCVYRNGTDEIKQALDFIEETVIVTDVEGNDMIIHTDDFSDLLNCSK